MSNELRREVLNMANLPPDLFGIRAAADQVGCSDATVRSYIAVGRGKRKLRTYRMPNNPNTVLVSLAELIRFASETARQVRRPAYARNTRQTSVNFNESESQALTFLRDSIKRRLKLDVTYPAIIRMVILEAARAHGWSDKPAVGEQAERGGEAGR